jgi:DnaJ-class molecular chaperone
MSDEEPLPVKVCEICQGSGQVCEFRGVSRFVLTWDDCPVCGGLGFITEAPEPPEKKENP